MKCSACSAEIPDGALVCNQCHLYQAGWKRRIQQVATLTGLFTLIASGVVFTVKNFPDAWDAVFGHDRIEVLAYAPHQETVIRNVGVGPVFLRAVEVTADRLPTQLMPINRVIEPDESFFADHSRDNGDWKRIDGPRVEEWGRLDNSKCYDLSAWNAENPMIVIGQRAVPGAVAVSGTGVAKYRSLRSGKELETRFATASVLLQFTNCAEP